MPVKNLPKTLSDASKAAKLLSLALQHQSISVEKLVEAISRIMPQVPPSSGRLTGKSHEQYLLSARLLLENKSESINLSCPTLESFINCYQFFRGLENTIAGPDKNLFKFRNVTAEDTLLRSASGIGAMTSNLILNISLTDEAQGLDAEI